MAFEFSDDEGDIEFDAADEFSGGGDGFFSGGGLTSGEGRGAYDMSGSDDYNFDLNTKKKSASKGNAKIGTGKTGKGIDETLDDFLNSADDDDDMYNTPSRKITTDRGDTSEELGSFEDSEGMGRGLDGGPSVANVREMGLTRTTSSSLSRSGGAVAKPPLNSLLDKVGSMMQKYDKKGSSAKPKASASSSMRRAASRAEDDDFDEAEIDISDDEDYKPKKTTASAKTAAPAAMARTAAPSTIKTPIGSTKSDLEDIMESRGKITSLSALDDDYEGSTAIAPKTTPWLPSAGGGSGSRLDEVVDEKPSGLAGHAPGARGNVVSFSSLVSASLVGKGKSNLISFSDLTSAEEDEVGSGGGTADRYADDYDMGTEEVPEVIDDADEVPDDFETEDIEDAEARPKAKLISFSDLDADEPLPTKPAAVAGLAELSTASYGLREKDDKVDVLDSPSKGSYDADGFEEDSVATDMTPKPSPRLEILSPPSAPTPSSKVLPHAMAAVISALPVPAAKTIGEKELPISDDEDKSDGDYEADEFESDTHDFNKSGDSKPKAVVAETRLATVHADDLSSIGSDSTFTKSTMSSSRSSRRRRRHSSRREEPKSTRVTTIAVPETVEEDMKPYTHGDKILVARSRSVKRIGEGEIEGKHRSRDASTQCDLTAASSHAGAQSMYPGMSEGMYSPHHYLPPPGWYQPPYYPGYPPNVGPMPYHMSPYMHVPSPSMMHPTHAWGGVQAASSTAGAYSRLMGQAMAEMAHGRNRLEEAMMRGMYASPAAAAAGSNIPSAERRFHSSSSDPPPDGVPATPVEGDVESKDGGHAATGTEPLAFTPSDSGRSEGGLPMPTDYLPPDIAAISEFSATVVASNKLFRQQLEMMKQNLALSKLRAEAVMTATSGGAFRYTTLRDTKTYIKRNAAKPMTPEEARSIVERSTASLR